MKKNIKRKRKNNNTIFKTKLNEGSRKNGYIAAMRSFNI